jgi:RNA polymerase sigma factor (sigma-70 family)
MGTRSRLVTPQREPDAQDDAVGSFDEFFLAEAPALFRRMCLVTGNRQEAEEIVQDAFLALLERWEKVAQLEDTVGYLYRTAFNRWKRLARRASRQLREHTGMAQGADAFAGVDERDTLDRALAMLTSRQRAAVVLTDVLGFTSPEAGRILGVRDVTVRRLASQGRATLRGVLEERDG